MSPNAPPSRACYNLITPVLFSLSRMIHSVGSQRELLRVHVIDRVYVFFFLLSFWFEHIFVSVKRFGFSCRFKGEYSGLCVWRARDRCGSSGMCAAVSGGRKRERDMRRVLRGLF